MTLDFVSDPRFVGKTPFVTTALLEAANLSQIWQMWSTWTADGQSVWGWVLVNAALVLWFNWYRVMVPHDRVARACTGAGILINACVIGSVLFFRYV